MQGTLSHAGSSAGPCEVQALRSVTLAVVRVNLGSKDCSSQ